MKYSYGCVTGNESIEIGEEWLAVLAEMDREEKNQQRKETRRHNSLDELMEYGMDFAGKDDAESVLMDQEFSPEVESALATLTEAQRRRLLMHSEGLTYMEIGKREGVDFRRVGKSVTQAEKKFKKFFC